MIEIISNNDEIPGIYCIYCKINNKIYIGSSIDLKKRKYMHFWFLKHNRHHSRHLQGAYNKYGLENMVFIIIENTDKSNLIKLEQKYLDKYKSFDQEKGFNISPTAGNTLGNPCSLETRHKISMGNKGKIRSQEMIERQKKTWKEERNELKQQRIEKRGKNFQITSPQGEIITSKGIKKFARDNNIHSCLLFKLLKNKITNVGGWTNLKYV
jgi:group I intron endonuclease